MQVGEINVKIGADTTGLDKGTKKANSSLNKLGKNSRSASRDTRMLGDSAAKAGKSLGGAATKAFALAGGVAAIYASVSSITKFEDSMLSLQAVISGTEDDMSSLESQARELGATTVFSATQAANAQKFLAQAGFDVNEVLSATPDILSLASAGQIDLATAADIASNVLGGMALNVDELNRVNDVMAATAKSSNTNITQLGDALSYAAPLASSAGVSIEETSAAIGKLSDAGLQSTRAGTGLLGVIRQLSNLTPKATEALSSYNVTSQDVDISSRGLTNVLKTLAKANISTADSFEIFGSEAAPAAQILSKNSDALEELTVKLQNSEGAARSMAEIMQSGVSASLKGMASAGNEVLLVLGDKGGKQGIIGLSETATGVLRDLAMAIDESSSSASDSQNSYDVLDSVLRGTAVSGRALFEVIDSLAGGISFLGTAAALVANGEFGLLKDAYVEYNNAVVDNIDQTQKFYETLYDVGGIRTAKKEFDDYSDSVFKLMDSFENQGSNSVVANTSSSGSSKGSGQTKSDSASGDWRKMLDEQTSFFEAQDELQIKQQEKEMQRSEEKLERLQETYLTEQELLKADYEEKQVIIDEALLNQQLSEEEHQSMMNKIVKDYAKARSDIERAELNNRLSMTGSILDNLSSLMNTKSKEMFEVGKAAAIGSAIINTAQGITSALKDVPYPFNLAAAASVGVAGAVQISTIQSQSFGGGGGGTPTTMAGGQPAVPTTQAGGAGGQNQQTQEQQNVNISLQGDSFSRDSVMSLIENINEAVSDGARIKVQ